MRLSFSSLGVAAACAVLAGSPALGAITDADSLIHTNPVNNYENSNFTLTDNFPNSLEYDEGPFGDVVFGAGFFANRHDSTFSADGGSTPLQLATEDPFDIQFDITLSTNDTTPRKEAGIRFNLGGFDGLFIITSDNGEVASFGAGLPFTSNLVNNEDGPEFGGTPYTPGTTERMRVIYRPPVDVGGPNEVPGSMEYVFGGITSGPRAFTNLELGIVPMMEPTLFAQFVGDQAVGDTTTANVLFDNMVISNGLPDFDNDGDVDLDDFNILAANFGTLAAVGITAGDADGDGDVDLDDFNLLAANFGFGTVESVGSLPEPTSLALLAIGGAAMLKRQRQFA